MQEDDWPTFEEVALGKCSFYDLLNSHEGFLTLQGYFIKATLLLDRDQPGVGGTATAGGQLVTGMTDARGAGLNLIQLQPY